MTFSLTDQADQTWQHTEEVMIFDQNAKILQ